uniref:Golgi transport 1A n=1 Tax=Mastacembelus armatus TaxID=205130 RepID=A0A7N9AXT7_9TELE
MSHQGHVICILQEFHSCQIGIGLMGFSLFFLVFGMLLYFDSVLLGFGNILFLTGLTFIIGFKRTAQFFFQRHKIRGSFFFLGGVSLVLCRWPIIGMLAESYVEFVWLHTTLASICMGLFKTLFLPRDTLAITYSGAYIEQNKVCSDVSVQCLEYVAH